ncbi:hypothetical protein OG909_11930 [Streptomyces sp. NBC_01754]|uniref:hypothetical protein n=1 Tax=Streptomyces sp. NBC_01754 TaxID=2975930 RepID=UPI002DD87AA1|nr:hypothetical protein [Streptomyces sp. NBC_01754]WSC92944.1 hypothetical protein OG909_11930 [Streptomyces sp. NBC_01754]
MTTVRDQAPSALCLPKRKREALPRLQIIALNDYATELDELIQSIQPNAGEQSGRPA